jgi:hypothetical protein
MSAPESRKRWNVGAWKLPYESRDVAHAVITDEDDHGYQDILGADTVDDDEQFPVGAKTAYTVELTDAEAEQFRAASNARYVEEQSNEQNTPIRRPSRVIDYPVGAPTVPSLVTQAWQRVRYVDMSEWHGRDVLVANLDGGSTSAVWNTLQLTRVGGQDFSGNPGGVNEHGCLSLSNAVPPGGRFLEAQIWGEAGEISDTGNAQALIWAADNGAKLANWEVDVDVSDTNDYWGGGVMEDAIEHARDAGMHIICAAGNSNKSFLTTPGNYCRLYANVHTSIAFDESTDRRGLFSNHSSDASGCTPGVDVLGLNSSGQVQNWNGTSASAPQMCQLFARALTGGRFTTNQTGTAFRNNPRDTGAGASQHGKGAWDLHLALAALAAVPSAPTTTGPYVPTPVDIRGAAGFGASMIVTLAPTVMPGDMQLVFLVSSLELDTVTGTAGWQVISDWPWPAGWEPAGTIGKTRVRVLARTYAEGDPTSLTWGFNGETHDIAFGTMTLRGAWGIDPNDFVPIARFGDSGSITTTSVLPNTANDLQVCMFAQRQETTVTSASLSVPTGLTDRAFVRPTGARTLGYALRLATRQLTTGARTPTYTSTSNDSTGTWVSVALTVPSSFVEPPPPPPPPEQELPQGPTSGVVAFLPHA